MVVSHQGVIHKKGEGAKAHFQQRFGTVRARNPEFVWYVSEQSLLDGEPPKGSGEVVSVSLRETDNHPYGFQATLNTGRKLEIYVDSADDLSTWMASLQPNTLTPVRREGEGPLVSGVGEWETLQESRDSGDSQSQDFGIPADVPMSLDQRLAMNCDSNGDDGGIGGEDGTELAGEEHLCVLRRPRSTRPAPSVSQGSCRGSLEGICEEALCKIKPSHDITLRDCYFDPHNKTSLYSCHCGATDNTAVEVVNESQAKQAVQDLSDAVHRDDLNCTVQAVQALMAISTLHENVVLIFECGGIAALKDAALHLWGAFDESEQQHLRATLMQTCRRMCHKPEKAKAREIQESTWATAAKNFVGEGVLDVADDWLRRCHDNCLQGKWRSSPDPVAWEEEAEQAAGFLWRVLGGLEMLVQANHTSTVASKVLPDGQEATAFCVEQEKQKKELSKEQWTRCQDTLYGLIPVLLGLGALVPKQVQPGWFGEPGRPCRAHCSELDGWGWVRGCGGCGPVWGLGDGSLQVWGAG